MAIRNRGKKKWQFAFGMPELIKAQRDLWTDQERNIKPIIDEYEKGMKRSFFVSYRWAI